MTTTRYQWDHRHTVIARMEVAEEEASQPVALLYPASGASVDQWRDLLGVLRKNDFLVTPDHRDGQYVLRVQNIDSTQKLEETLTEAHLVVGTPSVTTESKPPPSFMDRLRKSALRLSGMSYFVADASLLTSGILRKDTTEILPGALFLSNDAMLIFYGEKNPDRQMSRLYSGLSHHLNDRGFPLSNHLQKTVDTLGEKGTFIEKIENFFYDNPVLLNNGIQVVGGLCYVATGYEQNNPLKAASGVMLATSQLAGIALPEAPAGRDAQQTSGNPLSHVINWFLEKPLRITGWGSVAENLLYFSAAGYERQRNEAFRNAYESGGEINAGTLFSPHMVNKGELFDRVRQNPEDAEALRQAQRAVKRYQTATEGKHYYLLNGLTAVANLAANILFSFGSKNASAGLDTSGRQDELLAFAANVVAEQPPYMQHAALMECVLYLDKQQDITMPAEEIESALEQKVHHINECEWLREPVALAVEQSRAPASTVRQAKLQPARLDERLVREQESAAAAGAAIMW